MPRRLVVVAWQRPGTGLARVADRLLADPGPGWRVDLVGIGYGGPGSTRGAVTLHPTVPGGRDTFGVHAAVEQCLSGPAPDAVLVCNDVWLLPRYARALLPVIGRTPLLAYLPLDGDPRTLSRELLKGLLGYRAIGVYTEWARRALKSALATVGEDPPSIGRVGHGVDTGRFRPAASPTRAPALAEARTALKARLFPDLEDPARTLLVLNANRPDARKRIDLTLEGFASFLRRTPGARARLVLHHAHTTREAEAAVRQATGRLGIEGKVIVDPVGSAGPVPDGRLARLMAACEVGVNTSMGEGWGLLAFEHAATGAAQVLGRHTAQAELWEGAAILVDPARHFVPRTSPLEMAELDADDVGAALATLYGDAAVRHDVSLRCHRRATEPRFGWDAASHAFRAFLAGAAEERSHPPRISP